jgi:hypothetical protein
MIGEARVKKYRNAEFIGFMRSTVELIDKYNLTVLAAVKQDLVDAHKNLDLSFKVSSGSRITATVQELDARRDEAITGLTGVCKFYTYHYDPAIKNASALVHKEIMKYGAGVARQTYQSETESLLSLVKDFETDVALKAALTLLGLDAWVAELKAANLAFNEAYLARVGDVAEKKVAPVTDYRPAAVAAYDKLVQHAKAFSIATPSEGLTSFVKELAELERKYDGLV